MSSSKNTDSVDHEEDAASTTTGVGTVATAIKSVSKAQKDGAPAIVTIAPPRRKNALVGYWEQKEEQAKAQKEASVELLRDSRANGTASAKQLYSINNTDKDKKETRVVVFPPKPPENAIFRDGNDDASRNEGEVVKDESKEIVQTTSSVQVKDVSDHQDPAAAAAEEEDGDAIKEVEVAPSKGYSTENSPVLDSSKNETVADAPNDPVKQAPKNTDPHVSDLPAYVELQRDDNSSSITTDQPTQSWRKRKGILCSLVILIVIVVAAVAALLGVFLGGSSNLQSPSQSDETSPSFMPPIPLIQQCSEKVSLEGKALGLYHNDTLPPSVAIDGANAVWATESGQ
eukprot:scaffold41309_cov139-Skeletonema_dohrnii-CCMP3373.AAC.1